MRSEGRATPSFLPVVVGEHTAAPTAVEIVVADVTVRVVVGTDVDYVASMVSALRRQC